MLVQEIRHQMLWIISYGTVFQVYKSKAAVWSEATGSRASEGETGGRKSSSTTGGNQHT